MTQQSELNHILGTAVKNWTPRKPPSKAPMQGNYCMLTALDIDLHAPKLFEFFQLDNKGWDYLSTGPYDTYDEFYNWLNKISTRDDPLFYAVIDIKTNLPVGLASYLCITPEHGSIEVGHLHFSKLLKKTPAATEAMYLMMCRAFDELGYRRYEWKCNALNLASRNAAERLGFKFEGIFRQSNVFKNHNRDTAWYSIIDSEWPGLKNKFQKWLHRDNFDSSGNQIFKLRDI